MANQVVEHLEIEGSGIYDIHDPSAAGQSAIDSLTTEVTTINNKIGNTDIGIGKTVTSAIKELQDSESSRVTSVDGQTGNVDLSNTYAPTSHTSVRATDVILGHVTLTDTIDNNETASAGKGVTPSAVKTKIDALTTLINQVDGRIPSLAGYVQNVNGQVPDPSAANGRVDVKAQHIPYSNTTSGMAATTTQDAIDELKATTNNFSEIEANTGIVSSELQTLTIDGITYTITGNVTANPVVTASDPNLTSIGIGGTNYIISGGGGSSSLSGLIDVSIDGNLSDGQVLIYNATMDMWTNGDVIATVADIGDIGNVSLTSLQNGQILVYDAANNQWVNQNNSGGGGTTDYTDLTNKPTINNVELSGNKTSSDLNLAAASHTHQASDVSGLATVATSGSYTDLSNKPTKLSDFTNDIDNIYVGTSEPSSSGPVELFIDESEDYSSGIPSTEGTQTGDITLLSGSQNICPNTVIKKGSICMIQFGTNGSSVSGSNSFGTLPEFARPSADRYLTGALQATIGNVPQWFNAPFKIGTDGSITTTWTAQEKTAAYITGTYLI